MPEHALDADADQAFRGLIARLARPHPSGGQVVERASLLSAGDDFGGVMAWIEAHGGEPEFAAVRVPRSGMSGFGLSVPGSGTPLRFILPAGALAEPIPSAPSATKV